MGNREQHRIICAIDTGDLDEALSLVRRLSPYVGAFKIGHALTLPYGLSVADRLQEAGAPRIFLDLKFHDIPNSVGAAVREATRHGVWMMTLHLSGGPAMLSAAVEEAKMVEVSTRPCLVGVSVLTSLNQSDLRDHLGVQRTVEEHMLHLSRDGVESGLDGVVCSTHEIAALRVELPQAILVTPGIRAHGGELQDQQRVGDGRDAIEAGADYLVIGRPLTSAEDPVAALQSLRLWTE